MFWFLEVFEIYGVGFSTLCSGLRTLWDSAFRLYSGFVTEERQASSAFSPLTLKEHLVVHVLD